MGSEAVPKKVPPKLLTAILLAPTMESKVSANKKPVPKPSKALASNDESQPRMTREEAYSRCPADSYVEYYGSQWLIVPFEPVEQPRFFECRPVSQPAFA